MRAAALRILVVIVFAASFISVGASTASADWRGAYKWNSTGYPGECLTTGVNLLTSSSPDKHNVSGSNSCFQGFTIDSDLYEYNSNNEIIDTYFDAGATDYAQAHLQLSTSGGDYWVWRTCIDDSTYCQSCSNHGFAYQDCFNT